MNEKTKFIAKTAVFLTLALCIGVVENLIPPIFPFMPYLKIGFSNIVIVLSVLLLNSSATFIIVVLKSFLVPIFVGNPIMILYSLPASIVTTTATVLLLRLKKFGIPAISIVSAILHNLSQLCIASLMTNYLVFGYTPYFVLIGTLSGLATGIISYVLVRVLPKTKFFGVK